MLLRTYSRYSSRIPVEFHEDQVGGQHLGRSYNKILGELLGNRGSNLESHHLNPWLNPYGAHGNQWWSPSGVPLAAHSACNESPYRNPYRNLKDPPSNARLRFFRIDAEYLLAVVRHLI